MVKFGMRGVPGLRWGSPQGWWPYALGFALVGLLLVALASVAIWQERLRQRERAQAATQNIARLLEGRVADVLSKVDVLLRVASHHARDHLEGGLSASSAEDRQLQAYRAAAPEVLNLNVVDAQGDLHYGQGLNLRLVLNMAQTPEFMRARLAKDERLIMLGPLRRAAGDPWVLVLSRAVHSPAGQFLGMVTADLPIEVFGPIFREVDLGTRGAATLRTDQLALVFRQPWPESGQAGIGGTEVSAQLRSQVATQPESGEYVAVTTLDGIARINAYRKVRGHGLYLLVGLPETDFPKGWNRTDAGIVALALTTLLVAAFSAWQLFRVSRRQIDAAQQRYEAIVEFSHDAIVSKTLDGMVTSWNAGAERMFGHSAAAMIGRSIQRIYPPGVREAEAEVLARLRMGETVEHFDTQRLHSSGRSVPVSVTLSPVVSRSGEIVGASMIARDISRQKAMEEEVRSLAFLDALTRLPNRRLLLDRLRQAQLSSRRLGLWGGLVFIDLDQFKALNDAHGHDVGDQFLVEVAARLRLAVRESDTVARLGGDEFVVICENLAADLALAAEAAQAVHDKIAQALKEPWLASSGAVHCGGASLGVRLFLGDDDDLDQLIHDADQAMYVEKASHRKVERQLA
ncbi:DUF4381 family protein [Ideonella sp.]|uniref:DUF4381 family protein n=1 Tax=Ideonella sp. TaxID=1929293 RepID=UPI003BB77EE7